MIEPSRPGPARVIVLLGLSALLAACGAGAAGGSPDGTEVRVTLSDYQIGLSTSTVAPGRVRLAITNQGPSTHELEVLAVPDGVDPASLPVTGGVADTAGVGMTVLDEVEDIAPSTATSLVVTLEPGRYALICNVATHYALGMRATLTVEP